MNGLEKYAGLGQWLSGAFRKKQMVSTLAPKVNAADAAFMRMLRSQKVPSIKMLKVNQNLMPERLLAGNLLKRVPA